MRTYLGLFDDKVAQYDLGKASARDNLLKGVVRDALFGSEGYLNDGYFLMNPLCQEAILGDSSHLLRAMLESGQIRLLSNSEDIERSLILRSESMVRDFGDLMKTERWKEIRRRLQPLSKTLHDRNLITPWPRGLDLGSGFKTLIQRFEAPGVSAASLGLKHASTEQVQRVCARFFKRMGDETNAARTRWEECCAEELGLTLGHPSCFKSLKMRELMSLGNSAYHFNFALAIGASEGASAAVETINTDSFDELLDVPSPDLNQLRAPKELTIPSVPSLMNGHAVRDFLSRHDSDKQAFLKDYEDYLARRVDKEYFEGSAGIYREHIARHFGTRVKLEDTMTFKGIWTLVFFAGGAALDAAAPDMGHAAKAAGAAIGFMTDNLALPHVMRKLAIQHIERAATRKSVQEQTRLANQFKRASTLVSVLDKSKTAQALSMYKRF